MRRRILLALVVTALLPAALAGGALLMARRPLPAQPPAPASPTGTVWYQNGSALASGAQPDYSQDVKQVVTDGAATRFTNYPAGYTLVLPSDMRLDLSYSPAYIRAANDSLTVKLSREWSPYADVRMYLRDYLNRFISNADYRKANSIDLLEDTWTTISGRDVRIISFARNPAPGSPEKENQYLFAYVLAGRQNALTRLMTNPRVTSLLPNRVSRLFVNRTFYNLFFRSDDIARERPEIDRILASLSELQPRGEAKYSVDMKPVAGSWNQETAATYARLQSATNVEWGIYYPWALTKDYAPVAAVEAKLGYHFPILLHYIYLGDQFPTAGMEQARARGQTVELTLQIAEGANDNAPRHNANFDVLDGARDGDIRAFARAAKAFGHPFFFRLNNEMNTDWSQYSGVLLLSDNDIYIKVWRHIYDIFRDEGVDNAIWVFNPNDRNYPPVNWNADVSYYPGNGYVQVLGITGYNTGTYFHDVTGETWRSFTDIYRPMAAKYRPLYGKFPWIITEFASSSVGGDKAQWITDMYAALPEFPEIKAAVWWSYYDPDEQGNPARRYWLDETPETIAAFRAGLEQQGATR